LAVPPTLLAPEALLSLPPLLLQAASAAVATSTPAARPARLSFTIGSPSSI
jgi:hypothetical protein